MYFIKQEINYFVDINIYFQFAFSQFGCQFSLNTLQNLLKCIDNHSLAARLTYSEYGDVDKLMHSGKPTLNHVQNP